MKLSCFVNSLDEGRGLLRRWRRFRGHRIAESKSMAKLAALGINRVDVCPSMLQTAKARASLQSLGLEVSCLAIAHDAPCEATLDSDDPACIDPLIQHMNKALDHAADLGALWTYVVPGPAGDDPVRTLRRHAAHYAALAERGSERGVKVCVEHFPDTALPTVAATLDFIRDIGHPNLYLLFDIGHAQMSGEDPAKVLPLAGDRLGYIHLDDNDEAHDLHLALTDGVQTPESLGEFFRVLEDIGYTGPLSLEMNRTLPDPLAAIRLSKQIVERFVELD